MDKKIAYTKAGKNSQSDSNVNTAHNQRLRLLDHLKTYGSITTIEARRELDILSPAARKLELLARGFNIVMVWVEGHTESGRKHRIAKYVLVNQRLAGE